LNLSLLEMFSLMVFGHALADYPLQGEFLAKSKNRTAPVPGMPWYQALAAHAIIQGGFVGIVTGSLPLAVAETVVHAITDDLKCRGKLGFNADQFIHIGSKFLWCALHFLVLRH